MLYARFYYKNLSFSASLPTNQDKIFSHTFIQTNLPGPSVVPSDRAFWAENNK